MSSDSEYHPPGDSNRSCRLQYLEYLLVVEDKIGECQLYGEMLLSAVIRYR